MNIFYLDSNPKKCAKYHNDKHVVKMILETAQLLCGAHWATGSQAPYKPTHLNHPCAIWVRANRRHYMWLCELGMYLSWEYSARYGGKTHKTSEIITWLTDNMPELPDSRFVEPPLAMPDECKIANSAVLSYRNYYMTEKKSICSWKNVNKPSWFVG